ncbi:hypothetical protein [Paludisphaera soli]|uniref:hypothetical protein n=1 Tax=Paludisphaera soli TaxID=2712865 RepID=UPI0013EE0549|nr:hypothetical protein [Paludisphaera soli]
MRSYEDRYRALFQDFGYPLAGNAALSTRTIEQAEARLGVRVPASLRAYYLVAGREKRFNLSQERLLPPSEWTVEGRRLVFLEENQNVCIWGVSVRDPDAEDPAVSEGEPDDESASWHGVLKRKCSDFLACMLHHQAVYGGLPHLAFGAFTKTPISADRLAKLGWKNYGEMKGETSYSRPNQVVTVAPIALPFAKGWTVNAGARTKRDLEAIQAELGLEAG